MRHITMIALLMGQLAATITAQTPSSATPEKFPATLDLVERAELAINPLTSFADPNHDYAVWWMGILGANPPRMQTSYRIYGKFTEALPLVRTITDSPLNRNVDDIWRQQLLQAYNTDNPRGLIAHGPDRGRHLVTLAILNCLDPNGPWLDLGKKMVDQTLKALIDRGDWGYLETWSKNDPNAPPSYFKEQPTWIASMHGWTLQGLAQFYRQTGYEPALTAARKIAYYLLDHAGTTDPNGAFLARHNSNKGPALHFHHNANIMEALSEFVLISGDRRVADRALKVYRFARSVGVPEVGFFPEYINDWPDDRRIYDCEGCCVADMVATSLNLSLTGVADLWDDLDRYIRNMFSEMQMLDDRWLLNYSATIPASSVTDQQYADHVPAKLVGDFAGWAPFNEFYGAEMAGIMHCCLGNCARAIYHVWLNCVTFGQGTLKVNLLLNHESRWATVKSLIPCEGAVEITPKQNGKLVVRIPEYVSAWDLQAQTADRKNLSVNVIGRWADLGQVAANKTIILKFPLPVAQKRVDVGGVSYTLTFKGNVAMDCQPRGTRYPFFVHPEYQRPPVWRETRRIVPSRLPFLDGALPIKTLEPLKESSH
jgi:hypothetical protein